MILKVGSAGKYFLIDGKLCQCGQFDYEFTADNKLRIWDKVGSNKNSGYCDPLTNVLNGDNANAAFANKAAIETWLAANFFFIASGNGGGGGTVIAGTAGKIAKFNGAGNNVENSLFQESGALTGVNGISPTGSKFFVSCTDGANATPIEASTNHVFATCVATKNTTTNKRWLIFQGGSSGQAIGGIGPGVNSYGFWCESRYGGSYDGNRRAFNFVMAENGNNYANGESIQGDELNGKFGIGYTVDATLPQRLSVIGGAYFSKPVGIGTPTPNAGCILDLNSTTQGLGLPNLTTAQILAIPTAGLKTGTEVFNTTLQKKCVYTSNGWEKCTQTAM